MIQIAYATYAAGETVCRTSQSREKLHVVLDGVVRAAFRYEGDAMLRSTKLRSGELFDLRLLNLAGVYVGFPNRYFEATAETDCRVFSVAIADLIQLCRDHRQFGSFLRVLAIDQLARAYEKETAMEPTAAIPRDAYGTSEALDWIRGARSRDFSRPYDADERKRFLKTPSPRRRLKNAWAPLVQPGCLNSFNPPSGEAARKAVEEKTTSGLMGARMPSTPRMPVRLNSWYTQYTRSMDSSR